MRNKKTFDALKYLLTIAIIFIALTGYGQRNYVYGVVRDSASHEDMIGTESAPDPMCQARGVSISAQWTSGDEADDDEDRTADPPSAFRHVLRPFVPD